MFKIFLEILLLGHVVGDFYFQTEKMAERKRTDIKWVGIHSLCYCGAMFLVGLSVRNLSFWGISMLTALLHGIIDVVKFYYVSNRRTANDWNLVVDRNIFFLDQVLHFLCIGVAAYWGTLHIKLQGWNVVEHFFWTIGVKEETALAWILMLLLIHKPANIAIQKLLTIYKPVNREEPPTEEQIQSDKNAGRFIGTIERIIMLIFLSLEQYSAIGLVLTAKSIARYDRITREQDFAEYYLLGTLISTLLVIGCAQVLG